jgi:hypothetical protein
MEIMMTSQIKRMFLKDIGSSRTKMCLVKAGCVILFCGFQSSYCMEQKASDNYYRPYSTHHSMTSYNECQGDLSAFIPTQRTREVLGSVVKAQLTTFMDNQLEEQFPTRDNLQNIDLGNLTLRIVCKGLAHLILNIAFEIFETGAQPTKNHIKTMLHKTLIDVAASEFVHNFMSPEYKNVSRTLLHGTIHGIFQASHADF